MIWQRRYSTVSQIGAVFSEASKLPNVHQCGSLDPNSVDITQASSEQTRLVGWDNFLRGRISQLWGRAWQSPVIKIDYLTFSHQLVCYPHLSPWNSLLHYGSSEMECFMSILLQNTKPKREMTQSMKFIAAYEAFKRDKFLIPHNFQYLFSPKSLSSAEYKPRLQFPAMFDMAI